MKFTVSVTQEIMYCLSLKYLVQSFERKSKKLCFQSSCLRKLNVVEKHSTFWPFVYCRVNKCIHCKIVLQNRFLKHSVIALVSLSSQLHISPEKKLLLIKVQIKQVLLLKEQFSFLALSKAIKMTLKLMIFHCLSNCNFLLKFHKTGLIKNDR